MAKRGFVVPRPSHAARRRLRRELVVEMMLDDGKMRTRLLQDLKTLKERTRNAARRRSHANSCSEDLRVAEILPETTVRA